ncbi:MAG: hypothetical protein ACFCBV_07210 [Phycisphaerales bacterium]|mgnify:CR=1 FL=1
MQRAIVGGGVLIVVLGAALGFWRWRVTMQAVTQTPYAAELYDHILSPQLERHPGASDRWAKFADRMAEVRRVRESLGDDAERLRRFDIEQLDADALPELASAVEAARAAGLYELARDVAGIRVASRPYDEMRPDDYLVGVMFEEIPDARFLHWAQSARTRTALLRGLEGIQDRADVLGESLALAEIYSWQANILEYTVAWRFAIDTLRTERLLLAREPIDDDDQLRAIDARIEVFQDRFAPASHVIGGDRFLALDSLHRMHTVGGRLDRRQSVEWDGTAQALGFDRGKYRGPLSESVDWLERISASALSAASSTGESIIEADAEFESRMDAFANLGVGTGKRWPALSIVLNDYGKVIAYERERRASWPPARVS